MALTGLRHTVTLSFIYGCKVKGKSFSPLSITIHGLSILIHLRNIFLQKHAFTHNLSHFRGFNNTKKTLCSSLVSFFFSIFLQILIESSGLRVQRCIKCSHKWHKKDTTLCILLFANVAKNNDRR